MTPSLCGSFVTDKRSLVAFTWTLTCVFTLIAFITSTVMVIHIHTSYKRMERAYYEDLESRQYEQQQEGEGHSADNRDWEDQLFELASMQSGSLTFMAVYTMILAVGLSFYGSTAIVGFTSLRGVYIAPCFSTTNSGATSSLKLGMFGGAIVFFANLLLICAVICGEVRVEDWQEYGEGEKDREQASDREPYEIERIATVLAVTCMFLAALYSIFAILLFLYFGSKENLDENDTILLSSSKQLSSIGNDPRRETFITMGERDLS